MLLNVFGYIAQFLVSVGGLVSLYHGDLDWATLYFVLVLALQVARIEVILRRQQGR